LLACVVHQLFERETTFPAQFAALLSDMDRARQCLQEFVVGTGRVNAEAWAWRITTHHDASRRITTHHDASRD